MNIPGTSVLKIIRNRKTILLFAAFTLFGSVQTIPAQGNDLQSAAAKIDKMLTRIKRTKVIVTDFFGPKNGVTEYGQAIADELSAELVKVDANLNVVPRNGQSYTFGPSAFSEDFREGSAAWFLARSVGAEIVITGTFQEHSDRVTLNLHVWDNPSGHNNMPGERLGDFSVRLSITAEQKAQVGRAIPLDPPNGFRLTAGKRSATFAAIPTCISCMPPMDLGKNEVNLLLTISAEGRVIDVKLISASNQKIGDKAVNSAKQWRFHPAHGPDGKPIEIQIPFIIGPSKTN
jgi:TonB family protein